MKLLGKSTLLTFDGDVNVEYVIILALLLLLKVDCSDVDENDDDDNAANEDVEDKGRGAIFVGDVILLFFVECLGDVVVVVDAAIEGSGRAM